MLININMDQLSGSSGFIQHNNHEKTKDLQAILLESPLENSVNDLISSDLVVFLFLLAAIAADAVQHK